MTEQVLVRVVALLREGRSLEAIKTYRQSVGCTLFEALDAIHNIQEGRDPRDPRPQPLPVARVYRFVGSRRGQPIRQFLAFPRKGQSVDRWARQEMGWPRVLVLIDYSDHAMLFRYTADATFAGDTWAETSDAAKEQADFEYGSSLEGQWIPIPAAVPRGSEHLWALLPLS